MEYYFDQLKHTESSYHCILYNIYIQNGNENLSNEIKVYIDELENRLIYYTKLNNIDFFCAKIEHIKILLIILHKILMCSYRED